MKENTARKITIIEPIKALETQKLRVAAYARVSSDSEDQLNSFATQVSYYNQLIRENDRWELIEVFADEGVTGVSMEKRTEFNRMIEECRQGNIDRILTKSVSRFARNTLDSINTLRELKSLGVSVLFEKEGIDTENLSGENLVTLYSMCAQQESMSISQNCKKGVRMKMADGTYVASNPPYGYRLVNNRLEIYEAEAAVVRRIFREYLNGSGIELIIKSLNGDGIKPKNSGKSWRYSTISGILENERYIGDKLFQKKYREDLLPYHLNRNKGELPKYYIEHCHDPIIDKMQYQLVKILRDNRRMDTHTNPNRHLLSKKIICKRCSATYKYRILAGIIYWVCRSHNQNASTCPSERITEESIYNAFIRMYNKLKANSDSILTPMLSQLEKLREQSMRGSAELSTLNKQIAETAEQIQVMTGLLARGILDSAIFIPQSNELKGKLQKLKGQKSKLLVGVKKDALLTELEELQEIIQNGPNFITEMDEELFEDMVTKIEAEDSQSIDFILHGGLRLTERL